MIILLTLLFALSADAKPRARQLGVPFAGTPGPLNAITDVAGVEVGHATLIKGEAIRTGVTMLFPRGRASDAPVFAATFALNGTGEMTGTAFIEEYGVLEGPVALTNSQSIGTVRDAVSQWLVREKKWDLCCLPVVAETFDGYLNDIHGFHVRPEHVLAAIGAASSGPVAEGSVGGGTGMVAFHFKGGIGTSSRRVGNYTLGVLVQANMAGKRQLTIAGIPVGERLAAASERDGADSGSIIILIATDAPLLPHQLKRLARRASLGLARTGAISGDTSGDIFLAFTTATPELVPLSSGREQRMLAPKMLPNEALNPLFEATVQAVEEAIVNVLFAAETMTGFRGRTIEALPVPRTLEILREHKRLSISP
ncbi:MAG TPA: P1 family peptidase [Thermoanaerobaculia bacterium]|nr:P1 family peptidase [Thermoanaerobaculia bacterium]